MSALFDLTGRTALITGATRGLGRAFAQGLAEAGASVIVNGRSAASTEQAAADLRAQGFDARASAFDVTDEASVAAAFAALDDVGVAVDILINNAGIQHRAAMVDLALADWQRVIDTNLTSAFIVGRAAAQRMIARGSSVKTGGKPGGGKIINIGSLTSAAARASIAPYTAAKGGIKLLSCAMAAEWAQHNIQVNAIGPGYIQTDMNTALMNDPDFDAWVKRSNPAGRWGQPDELIGTAVYLASPASNYVNGQIIYVDGGWLAVL